MNEAQVDKWFLAVVAAFAAFVLLFPNAFIYLGTYGGRLKYRPPAAMVIVTRVCAAFVLLILLRDALL